MDHEHVTMSPCDLTQDLVVDGVPNANSRDRYVFGLWRRETRLERRIGFIILSRTTTGRKISSPKAKGWFTRQTQAQA